MGSATLDVGFEPLHRPPFDIPTLSDAVRRLREGGGKWDQETLACQTVTGKHQIIEMIKNVDPGLLELAPMAKGCLDVG